MKGKPIIAIEIDNYENEIERKGYKGMYAASKGLNINSGLIKYCCDRKDIVKSRYSKIMERDIGLFNYEYFFIYRFI